MATTAQLAGILPRIDSFREWVGTFTNGQPVTVEIAAAFIREVCQVSSRAELATNPRAERRFHQLLRRPYIDWRDAQRKHSIVRRPQSDFA